MGYNDIIKYDSQSIERIREDFFQEKEKEIIKKIFGRNNDEKVRRKSFLNTNVQHKKMKYI